MKGKYLIGSMGIIGLSLLLTGCNSAIKIVSDCSECYENETCQESGGISPFYECYPLPRMWELPENMTFSDNRTATEVNISALTRLPRNELIPAGYIKKTIYETICICEGLSLCNFTIPSQCSCEEYCYNQSREIWISP